MTYVVTSFSGGKDSTAMVLRMVELGERIDEVLNVDTGMEFPEMYEHIAKVREILEDHGIKFTSLKADQSFEWYMFDQPVNSKKYPGTHGNGWPATRVRWCTHIMKMDQLDPYLRNLRTEHPDMIQCVGLAADEVKRLERPNNQGHRHPLVEWGWAEADCLAYCKSRGFDWGGLYDRFARVSCWCCPLQRIGEFRALYTYHPELWAKLQEWENRMHNDVVRHPMREFTSKYTIEALTRKFEKEIQAQKNQTTLHVFEEGEQ